jgi:hypothetical protein
MRERWKQLLVEYGKIALIVYLVIFALVFAGFAVAIGAGYQPEGAAGSAGLLGAAWVATKLTQPLRILATLALTPIVGRLVLRRRDKPADPDPPSPAPQKKQSDTD